MVFLILAHFRLACVLDRPSAFTARPNEKPGSFRNRGLIRSAGGNRTIDTRVLPRGDYALFSTLIGERGTPERWAMSRSWASMIPRAGVSPSSPPSAALGTRSTGPAIAVKEKPRRLNSTGFSKIGSAGRSRTIDTRIIGQRVFAPYFFLRTTIRDRIPRAMMYSSSRCSTMVQTPSAARVSNFARYPSAI